MICEILRLPGPACAGEVGGTPAKHSTYRTDRCRNERAIWQTTDTECNVDSVVDQVQVSIRQDQLDVDFGEGREEIVNDRQKVKAAEHDGGCNNDVSPES